MRIQLGELELKDVG